MTSQPPREFLRGKKKWVEANKSTISQLKSDPFSGPEAVTVVPLALPVQTVV